MTWHGDIANELPSPRNDEPESLRGDIVDELTDHLACAVNRELHFTGDATTAKQNVLDKFGNPTRVARRLWLDAMKERLMSQRIAMATMALVTAVSLFVGFLAWQSAQRAQATNAVLLEQGREANEAILARLLAMPSPATTPAPLPAVADRGTLKFELVSSENDHKPVEGCIVQVYALDDKSGYMINQEKADDAGISNADGMVQFPELPARRYTVMVHTPWREIMQQKIRVSPREPTTRKIVCPAKRTEEPVTIDMPWPDDLKDSGLTAFCTFRPVLQKVGGQMWFMFDAGDGRTVALTPSGQTIEEFWEWDKDHRSQLRTYYANPTVPNRWSTGTWAIMQIEFSETKAAESQNAFTLADEPLASLVFEGPEPILVRHKPGVSLKDRDEFRVVQVGGAVVARERGTSPTFQIEPGKTNHWRIELPDTLVGEVRKALAARKATNKKT